LNKPGRLSKEEYAEIKKHPNLVADLFSNIDKFKDAYYPEFRQLTSEFSGVMQNCYDLITCYSKYLFSQDLREKSTVLTGGINNEIKL